MVQGGRVGGGKKFRDSSAVSPSNVERGEPTAVDRRGRRRKRREEIRTKYSGI